jgi:hypothetical protein
MPLIFQYGSNCDATRLNSPERLRGNAIDLGLAPSVGHMKLRLTFGAMETAAQLPTVNVSQIENKN